MTPSDSIRRCANCGEPAGPRFCPHCGQEVEGRRGPLVEVVREVFSEWLSLDSRLLRSLKALAVPGKLSALYLAGHRAPHLRPFRLYLVASVALFSTLLALENPSAEGLSIYVGDELVSRGEDSEVTRSLRILGKDTWIENLILDSRERTVARLREVPPQEIVDRLSTGARRTGPLALILFVPFLALGLKILYVRGRANHSLYFDHFVFALHYQSALFLALSATWMLVRMVPLVIDVGAGIMLAYALPLLIMPAIYLPLALRRFYGQSRFWTAVKTLILFYVYTQLLTNVLSLAIGLTFREL